MTKALGQDIYTPNDIVRKKDEWVRYSLWEEDGSDMPVGIRGNPRTDAFATALALARKMERQDPEGGKATAVLKGYLVRVTRQRGGISVTKAQTKTPPPTSTAGSHTRCISAGKALRFTAEGGVTYMRTDEPDVDVSRTPTVITFDGAGSYGHSFCAAGDAEAYFVGYAGAPTRASFYWFRTSEDEPPRISAVAPAGQLLAGATIKYTHEAASNRDGSVFVRCMLAFGALEFWALIHLYQGRAVLIEATSARTLGYFASPPAAIGSGYAATKVGQLSLDASLGGGFAPGYGSFFVDRVGAEKHRYMNTLWTAGLVSSGSAKAPTALGRGHALSTVGRIFPPDSTTREEVIATTSAAATNTSDSSDVGPGGIGGIRAGSVALVPLGDGRGLILQRRMKYGGDVVQAFEFERGAIRAVGQGNVPYPVVAHVCHELGGAVLIVTSDTDDKTRVFTYRGGTFQLRAVLPSEAIYFSAEYAGNGTVLIEARLPPDDNKMYVYAISNDHVGFAVLSSDLGYWTRHLRPPIRLGSGWVYSAGTVGGSKPSSTAFFMHLDSNGLHKQELGTIAGPFGASRVALCAEGKVALFADDGTYILTERTPTPDDPTRCAKQKIRDAIAPGDNVQVLHENFVTVSAGSPIDLLGGAYVRAGI